MSMEVDQPISFQPGVGKTATILCCNCGAPIDGTVSAGALCGDCIKATIDITQGIQREGTLHQCRDCDRWLSPPNQWLVAQMESQALLAICLRKLRGINKVRLTDASFIWTEPHSRRIKVKITIQSEFEGAILQQTFDVEFVQASQQCPECAKSYTHNTWRAVVQVRQKVPHKRTFLFLEQLILKHQAHNNAINIKESSEGIDFFFAQRNSAEKFVDFLKSVVPCNMKKSSELISKDIHTSTSQYKFTFSIELVPICKDDLVALPIKLAKSIGNVNPLTLCYRIGTSVNLIDVTTLQTADVSTEIYWRAPFRPLADVQELVEFVVLDIEPLGPSKGRFALAEATVARASDMGANDATFYTRTHLGGVLHPGDSVMGYLITGTNYNNPHFDALEESKYASTIPDVVLVKKHYPRRKKGKSRNWRLKRMAKEESEMAPRKQDQARMEQDFEMFLRDVEEDTELRAGLAVYKAQQQAKADKAAADAMEESDDDEEGPVIPMEQLLDEFEDLTMADEDGVEVK
ncbi:nonsense-mediated mRNA decay protein 3 [Lophium mytilinum]|uniref:60S ribosomal export protein NMD3 n=1 Tax=Lophium mytilinum TaxID=390894 RepID=A0A6A6QWW8_9PEZI|nr:nonsense-mediated mRNA decay protein 3 [Lophium mytilinum]